MNGNFPEPNRSEEIFADAESVVVVSSFITYSTIIQWLLKREPDQEQM